MLALAVCALLGVLLPGVGVTINDARRWIQLGPLTVQPSEFAKLAILIWGADLLARKESLQSLTRPGTCWCRWCRASPRWSRW